MVFDRETILTEELVVKQLPSGGGLCSGGDGDDYLYIIVAVVSGDATRQKVHWTDRVPMMYRSVYYYNDIVATEKNTHDNIV